ncbi:MAG: radical SAM protein [Treponema sp.]|jgi:MoaA/NifB/PqqE/SkfB family radical SAM enzyme|nr:radical SAM protein [Treponema sp.]
MDKRTENLLKSLSHPCFNGGCAASGKHTRIHLPVAPACNIQCNYCVRRYECANESRPGVTARVLSPGGALERFLDVREKFLRDGTGGLNVAGIAGPGDALADFEKTRETFKRIRKADRDVTFCLSTNGLLLPDYAGELADLGVSHVTVTVNAPDSVTGKRIYRYVDFRDKRYTGGEGASLLTERQYAGLALLKELGIVTKVNIVMLKGINDDKIPAIAEKVKNAGADICNIMQLIPVRGSIFEHLPLVSNAEITELRKSCEHILPQMYHCRQCRADAAGTLDEDMSHAFAGPGPGGEQVPEGKGAGDTPSGIPRRFAVASKTGMVVDQHFGHAKAFGIYEYDRGRVSFIEKREIPQYCFGPRGCGETGEPIAAILKTIADCSGLISMRIGGPPRARLEENGVRVWTTYNYISAAVEDAAKELNKNAEV